MYEAECTTFKDIGKSTPLPFTGPGGCWALNLKENTVATCTVERPPLLSPDRLEDVLLGGGLVLIVVADDLEVAALGGVALKQTRNGQNLLLYYNIGVFFYSAGPTDMTSLF